MKNHIIFKFIAVLLCAVFLLGTVGGACGILILTEQDLYNRSYQDAWDENVEQWADGLAYNVGHRYASSALGGCNTQFLDQELGTSGYYDVFDMSRVGYAVKDAQGEVIQRQPLDPGTTPEYSFTFPFRGSYMRLVEEMTRQEWEQRQIAANETPIPTEGETYLYDAVPPEGTEVYNMTVTFLDGNSEGVGSDEAFGYLHYDDSNSLYCRFYQEDLVEEIIPATVTHIVFRDAQNTVLFEAMDSAGVGKLWYQDGDLIFFTNPDALYGSDVPEETEMDLSSVLMGAQATVNRKTPIWTLVDGQFARQKYYYGKDYDVTIYATKVVDGILYGCTTKGYITSSAYHSEWVDLSDVTFLQSPAVSSDRGLRAICLERTPIWGLEDGECYDTGMYYMEGQEIGILVLGTFASGEWGMTDLGWVHLSNVDLPEAPLADNYDGPALKDTEVSPETTEVTEVIEEITFTASPIDPTEEMVNLEESQEGPVTAAEAADPTEVTMPEPSVAVYQESAEAEPTWAPEVATEPVIHPDITYAYYYNYDTDTPMMAGYTYEPAPEGYTVEIQLAPNALRYQHEWELFRMLFDLRGELPKILGISLLGLAICLIYLCCAAGKKPGTKEIQAGGLNRMPIDLYGAGAMGGIAAAVALAVVGARYFSQSNLNIAAGFALAMAYCASLLVVGFFFALAAQIKTPGGFWWRSSLCGRCCSAAVRLADRLVTAYDTKGEAALARFFGNLRKLIRFLLTQLRKCILRLRKALVRWITWVGRTILRFFCLLPLTWQWLLAGGAMIFFLFVTVAGRYDLGMILSFLFAVALVSYGAHAFGTLLEGVRRMNKGDLEEKVDDRLLIGAFKDFSDELNTLADVAVIAARKQLKSERMKTELITNVSHDIKTPLTSIINYVDLLQRPHTEAEQAQYLEVLDRQSQSLKKLIEDLMEMSKASTGNMAVDITVVDAAEAINQALGEFADKLEKADLLPVFRQPEESVQMLADGRLVWRVLSNLLSNAVKYAMPGTRVYIDLAQVDHHVVISLKNISREELNVQADELLERFVRGDASRNTEGSGLGLNIAHSLMQLQKGQLQILVDGDLFKVTLIFPGA